MLVKLSILISNAPVLQDADSLNVETGKKQACNIFHRSKPEICHTDTVILCYS